MRQPESAQSVTEVNLMDSSSVGRIKRVLAEAFGVSSEQIELESSPESIPAWDSLQHMNMVLALEEEFDLRFGLEEIEHLVSVRHIVERIDEKLNAATA
jgi:acyl carrier protein